MGITVKGKAAMAKKLGGLTANSMTYLAFGDSDTAFSKSQNALVGTENMREAATVASATTTDTDDTLQLSKSFSIASSMTSKEIGVFDAASTGNMGARTVVTTKSLTSGSTYAVVYKIIVSAS